MMESIKELVKLFLIFCKIGISTFGGGYAMLPVMKRELTDRLNLVTEEELLDYYAIGQVTPGMFAVNAACFVGHKLRGIPGMLAATAGVVFPSFVIILIIAGFISNFADIPVVQHAFAGIRVVVVVLILSTVADMWKKSVKGVFGYVIFAAAFVVSAFSVVSPAFVVIGCGLLGVGHYFFVEKGKNSGKGGDPS